MKRNLQEQVLYLTNELIKIKQSLGTALPDPIEGPEGPEGPEGQRGAQGEQGFGIVGFGTQLPSSGRDGDWFLLKKSTMSGIDFVMCRCVSQHWVAQFSMRGPAGPIANATEVVANPVDPYSEELKKIKIEGVTYSIPSGNYVKWIDAPEGETLTDQERDWIINGVFVNGELLGYKNPVLFPATKSGNYYYGVIAGPYEGTSYTIIGQYQINPDNSIVERGIYGNIELRCINVFNGKTLPNYPVDPINDKILVFDNNNELVWKDKPTAGMTVYRHSVSCSVPYSGFTFYVNIILLSTDNAAYTTVDEVWSKLYVGQTFVFGDKLALVKAKGANGMDIVWVDDPNTTISISKANTTFTSDTFSAI